MERNDWFKIQGGLFVTMVLLLVFVGDSRMTSVAQLANLLIFAAIFWISGKMSGGSNYENR
jgi:hypothetical protein